MIWTGTAGLVCVFGSGACLLRWRLRWCLACPLSWSLPRWLLLLLRLQLSEGDHVFVDVCVTCQCMSV